MLLFSGITVHSDSEGEGHFSHCDVADPTVLLFTRVWARQIHYLTSHIVHFSVSRGKVLLCATSDTDFLHCANLLIHACKFN
jgi:hypothetical protein